MTGHDVAVDISPGGGKDALQGTRLSATEGGDRHRADARPAVPTGTAQARPQGCVSLRPRRR